MISLLILLSLLQSFATGRLSWSYSDYEAHSQQLLSYKNMVLLETAENVSFMITVCNSRSFSLEDSSSYSPQQHSVQCLRPGFHQASLQGSLLHGNETELENSTFYIPLDNTPYCYSWAVSSQYSLVNSTSQVILKVWIQNSATSYGVSAQFNSLGGSPSLTVITPSVLVTSSAQGFSSSCSCWTFTIQSSDLPYEFGLEISGNGVIIFDCGVRPTKVLISRTKISNSVIELSTVNTSVELSAGQNLLLSQDPQVSALVVLLHGGKTFITQDDFQNILEFQISSLPGRLDQVTISDSALLLLVNGSLYTLPTKQGSPQLSGTNVDYVVSGGLHYSGENESAIVVAWGVGRSGFLMSIDGGMTFREILLQLATDRVHSVLVHPYFSEVTVLMSSENSTAARFERYNIISEVWNPEWTSFDTAGGELFAQFFPTVFGELLVWEDTALSRSPNGGLTVSELPVYTADGEEHEENEGEEDHGDEEDDHGDEEDDHGDEEDEEDDHGDGDDHAGEGTLTEHHFEPEDPIKQVALGTGGQFAVLTFTNRLFYGIFSVGHGVEIGSGVSSDDLSAAAEFNSIGELRIVSIKSGDLSVRKVPTYSLLLSTLYPPPACPYIQWQHNVNQAVYYLDTRGYIELWASLNPGQFESNQISVLSSSPGAVGLSITSQLTQTALEGSIQRNKTVRIVPSHPRDELTSRTALKLSASTQDLACSTSAEAVTLISVQCPPGRHIQVRRPSSQSTNCPAYNDFSYTIEQDKYDPELRGRTSVQGNVNLQVDYDIVRFGCPIYLPFSSAFKPVLDLYDGDTFIEEVTTDFVVWELKGRTDFGYNSTAMGVKCLSAPLNWVDLLENGTHPSLAWTPLTHRSCFESSGAALVGSAPYQIFNSTGGSSLVWNDYNGIYLLVAQVITPGYSYCDLRVDFAVEVYGAVSYAYIGYILLVATCLLGLFLLLVTYACYKQMLNIGLGTGPKKLQKKDN